MFYVLQNSKMKSFNTLFEMVMFFQMHVSQIAALVEVSF